MFTKADFITALTATHPELYPTKALAEKAFNGFCSVLADTLIKGNRLRLPGVGTLSVVKREARSGRNPQTGKPIQIPARRVVKFTISKTLKANMTK